MPRRFTCMDSAGSMCCIAYTACKSWSLAISQTNAVRKSYGRERCGGDGLNKVEHVPIAIQDGFMPKTSFFEVPGLYCRAYSRRLSRVLRSAEFYVEPDEKNARDQTE